MSRHHADAFIAALRALEERGDLAPMVALYADDAHLTNPTGVDVEPGPAGAERFWRVYRDSFREIRSEFRQVLADDDGALLEWTSTATLASDGASIRYDGVTALAFDGDRITRFRAYFDPADLGS